MNNLEARIEAGIASGGSGGGSVVEVTPIQTTGTKIASISVDGVASDLYAPENGGGGSNVSVDQIQTSGTKIATITVDDLATDLYAPENTPIVPNPSGSATAHLETVEIDGNIYDIPTTSVDVTATQSTGTQIATISAAWHCAWLRRIERNSGFHIQVRQFLRSAIRTDDPLRRSFSRH